MCTTILSIASCYNIHNNNKIKLLLSRIFSDNNTFIPQSHAFGLSTISPIRDQFIFIGSEILRWTFIIDLSTNIYIFLWIASYHILTDWTTPVYTQRNKADGKKRILRAINGDMTRSAYEPRRSAAGRSNKYRTRSLHPAWRSKRATYFVRPMAL